MSVLCPIIVCIRMWYYMHQDVIFSFPTGVTIDFLPILFLSKRNSVKMAITDVHDFLLAEKQQLLQ